MMASSAVSAPPVGSAGRSGQAGTKRKTTANIDNRAANDTTTSRRQKENQTYIEMAESLPLDPKDTKDLDRASVLRVTINFVKFRDMIADNERHSQRNPRPQNQLVSKVKGIDSLAKDTFRALDGFILVISGDGSLSYVSDNISDHLGLKQVDVIGHNIRDLVHPQDFVEVAHIFSDHEPMIKPDLEEVLLKSRQKHFVVRMRSTFSASVRSITRCASFKPMYCSAQVTYRPSTNPYKREVAQVTVLCRVAGLVDVKDMCLGVCVMSKHDINYNCRCVDNKMRIILGYDPADMINSNALQFFHPGDLSDQHQMEAHMQVITTGQSKSPCFRVLTKWGNWVWVRSIKQCTYDPSTQAPVGLVIYTWLIGPSDAIECNRAFINQYGSDHMPNAQQQFSDVLGDDFNPRDVQNSMYMPLHPAPGMPPAAATPTVTPKVEPIDPHFHHPTSFPSCLPGHAPCDSDVIIPQTVPYSSQPEQVFTTSPPVTPPTGTPVFPSVDHAQFQPVQTAPMQSLSSITSPQEGYPIGYMTPSPSGSESNSHSHFSPHGAHTEDGAFSSPNIHSYGYHSNLEGFPLSTSSRSSYGSQGHLPHMVSMATQPRGSVEDDGYATDVFSPPNSVHPCADGLPADLSSMCTIYFDPNSVPYPMATGRPGSYQQPPLYCQPIHETR